MQYDTQKAIHKKENNNNNNYDLDTVSYAKVHWYIDSDYDEKQYMFGRQKDDDVSLGTGVGIEERKDGSGEDV